MLARIYFIAGALLLAGYGLTCWGGWEFGSTMRMAEAPPAGAALQSTTGGSHSSGSRSGWIIFGGGK